MLKAYKYRIYPNQLQAEMLSKHFGCARHIYNWALDLKTKTYEENKKNLSKRELQNLLVASKKSEKQWLKEVNSQSLLASLLNLPKLPGIKAKFHREFEGKIKTVTIKRFSSGKYFASLLVDNTIQHPLPSTIEPDKTIGIDMGITHFLIDSEGNKTENPRFLDKSLHRLRIEQRKLSRKSKMSHQRSKQKVLVARKHSFVTNRRNNFIHQESAKLAVKNQATSFAVEDLHIKGMVRNRKLARAISNCGWGMFLSALAYKCEWNGKNLIKVGRFFASSKTCHLCLMKQERMPLNIREWRCPCGMYHDRDINAAKVIKQEALAQSPGHGGCIKSSPVTIPWCVGVTAKGQMKTFVGSQEAPHYNA